jgi:hypothetical protein
MGLYASDIWASGYSLAERREKTSIRSLIRLHKLFYFIYY